MQLERIAEVYGVEIKRGWQKLLAKKMGLINPSNVSAWKARGVPIEVLREVSENKKVSLDWLLTGEGEKINKPFPNCSDPPQVSETNTGYKNQPLAPDELQLIKLYRKLHPAEQEKVIEIAELYNNVKESRKIAGGGSDLKESNSKQN